MVTQCLMNRRHAMLSCHEEEEEEEEEEEVIEVQLGEGK